MRVTVTRGVGRTRRRDELVKGIPITMKSSCRVEFLMATDSISLAAKREMLFQLFGPSRVLSDLNYRLR